MESKGELSESVWNLIETNSNLNGCGMVDHPIIADRESSLTPQLPSTMKPSSRSKFLCGSKQSTQLMISDVNNNYIQSVIRPTTLTTENLIHKIFEDIDGSFNDVSNIFESLNDSHERSPYPEQVPIEKSEEKYQIIDDSKKDDDNIIVNHDDVTTENVDSFDDDIIFASGITPSMSHDDREIITLLASSDEELSGYVDGEDYIHLLDSPTDEIEQKLKRRFCEFESSAESEGCKKKIKYIKDEKLEITFANDSFIRQPAINHLPFHEKVKPFPPIQNDDKDLKSTPIKENKKDSILNNSTPYVISSPAKPVFKPQLPLLTHTPQNPQPHFQPIQLISSNNLPYKTPLLKPQCSLAMSVNQTSNSSIDIKPEVMNNEASPPNLAQSNENTDHNLIKEPQIIVSNAGDVNITDKLNKESHQMNNASANTETPHTNASRSVQPIQPNPSKDGENVAMKPPVAKKVIVSRARSLGRHIKNAPKQDLIPYPTWLEDAKYSCTHAELVQLMNDHGRYFHDISVQNYQNNLNLCGKKSLIKYIGFYKTNTKDLHKRFAKLAPLTR